MFSLFLFIIAVINLMFACTTGGIMNLIACQGLVLAIMAIESNDWSRAED